MIYLPVSSGKWMGRCPIPICDYCLLAYTSQNVFYLANKNNRTKAEDFTMEIGYIYYETLRDRVKIR